MAIVAGTVFGHRVGGRLVSSAGLYRYGSDLASLGVVIVHPDFQRMGLGKELVQRCLRECEPADMPVSLIATKDGFPLYTSLGFQTVGTVHRFMRTGIGAMASADSDGHGTGVLQANVSDWVRMDKLATGAERRHLYELLLPKVYVSFSVPDPFGRLQGFGAAVRRGDLLVIGPLMAADEAVAKQVIAEFLRVWSGTIRLDVPGEQSGFIRYLKRLGFRETMVSPLMVLDGRELPGQRNMVYGIMDPAFG